MAKRNPTAAEQVAHHQRERAERLLHILGEQDYVRVGEVDIGSIVDPSPRKGPRVYWEASPRHRCSIVLDAEGRSATRLVRLRCPTFSEALRRAELANERMAGEAKGAGDD